MSCLAPAPLSDLATKSDLARIDKRFERVDQRFDTLFALREADRTEAATLREQDRAQAATLREQDRAQAAALREQDRAERKSDLRSVKAHHYTVIGFIVALFVANLTIL